MSEPILLGKNIVLGVSGSIAAYKSAEIIRRLKDLGANVKVVMTRAACEFITPLTLQTLSGQPVAIELLDADEESAMGHIKLARWADWILIAPASANTIARLAHGRTDDLLSATCLATESPIVVAPAMNNKMWSNPATQANLDMLHQRGVYSIGPASGDQACGETGAGRLVEPADIITELCHFILPTKLSRKHVLITAGPTFEPIDPVRFIGNRSSGKMGFSLAKAAVESGANVTLISGPVNLATPAGVKRINVETGEQMHAAVMSEVASSDIFIGCAAVSDYRPEQQSDNKIKKTKAETLNLTLVPTIDIISDVTQLKQGPFVVGFAAETQSVETYAQAKLERKQLDMIAANKVGEGQGFSVDNNELHVVWPTGSKQLPFAPKLALARDLMSLIIENYYAKNSNKNSR
jgi:phosphopantothenoylcysteine decarboxylase/phosphopantothenate--cysteine ligase